MTGFALRHRQRHQQTRVDTLIKALKSGPTTGTNYFTILDRLWLFAGESSDPQSRTCIVSATTGITNHNGVVLSANGYTGDTVSKYLSTLFVPSTAGGHYARDSASIGVYLKTAIDTNHTVIGTQNTGGGFYSLMNINNGCELNGSSFPGPSITQPGMWLLSRTSSVGYTDYHNEVAGSARSSPSNGTMDNAFMVCAGSDYQDVPNALCSDTIMMAFIGGGLTPAQAVEFSHIINAYMTAWGVNTY